MQYRGHHIVQIIVVFLSISAIITHADFTDISQNLPGMHSCSLSWGDYDDDGDLDLIISGDQSNGGGTNNQTRLFRNDGDNVFTEIATGMTSLWYSVLSWADYDNDNDLDLLLTGKQGKRDSYIAILYRNDGNGHFTDSGMTLTGVFDGDIAWGDYNNDGYCDVVIAGYNGNDPSVTIYRNNDSFELSNSGIHIPGRSRASVEWIDYDHDGDLDLAVAGHCTNHIGMEIYINDDTDSFSQRVIIHSNALYDSSMVWKDFDQDNDLDVALTGSAGITEEFWLYENVDQNIFTLANTNITGVHYPSLAGADYDNDGDIDLIVSGEYEDESSYHTITELYRNDGNFVFTNVTSPILNFRNGDTAWGDYDNDGDLDIAIAGGRNGGPIMHIYRNNCTIANTAPETPATLTAVVNEPNQSEPWMYANLPYKNLTLNWEPSTDDITPQSNLTYNIFIGKSLSDCIVYSAGSDLSDGNRKTSLPGNADNQTSWTVYNLVGGEYYCGVQAIDSSGKASAFRTTTFSIPICEFQFNAFALTNSVYVRWTAPRYCGISNNTVHVRYHTDHHPTDLNDGNILYSGTNQLYIHDNLTPNQPYYYTIWVSHDGSNFIDPP